MGTRSQNGREPSPSRTALRNRIRLGSVLLLVGGLATGFLAGRISASEVGGSPAIDVARELGVAIPEAQLPAFSDGIVTFSEVAEAYERFVACVGGQEAAGFSSSLDQDGSLTMRIEGQDDVLQRLVLACQIEHLEATRQVYLTANQQPSEQ